MPQTIQAPFEYIEELAHLEFPSSTRGKLQNLMDRNSEGTITQEEKRDLRALVELSERLALIRGQAKVLLQALKK